MTSYDRSSVAAIADLEIPFGAKGWPAEATGMPASAVAEAGWRVLDGDLPFPALVLRESALAHNLEAMRAFCEASGALLAPHGKTTMMPQLFARQLDAGAWAMTAATPVHLGCRSVTEALDVARAVDASPRLRLAGVEGFEGLAPEVPAVDAFLDDLAATLAALEDAGLLGPDALVSAGGSAYFDRVVERFAGRRLVLRGGCYLTHDDGIYARDSPLDGRAQGEAARLRNALCTTLDRWRVIPTVDDDHRVVGALHTFF
jgi:D-serine deaminase-like pyridoxal phosphate-dependent protein